MRLAEIWNGDLVWDIRTSAVALAAAATLVALVGARIACHAVDAEAAAKEASSVHRL